MNSGGRCGWSMLSSPCVRRREGSRPGAVFMVRLRLISLVLPAALVAVAAGCGGGSGDVPAGAIAVVGGHEISKARYDRMLEQAKKGYKQSGRTFPKAGTPEFQTLKTNAVNYLVEREQFELAAADLGVKVDDEDVTKRLSDLKKQYFASRTPPSGRSAPTGAATCNNACEKRYEQA